MTDPLEAELDRLFALPPGELVAARNELADRLKKAGAKEAAARIKALKRPTPVAWALNQVHFEHPELLDDARAAAEELRALHAGGGADAQALASAMDAHRQAINAIVDAAMACCARAGLQSDSAQQRKVYTSVQAWLTGAGDEQPGRMTHEIESVGFDALAGLGALPARPSAGPARPAGTAVPATPATAATQPAGSAAHDRALEHAREVERAAALVAEHEQRARAASEEARRRLTAQEQGQRELERAQRQLREAEESLRLLRTQLEEREAALAKLEASTRSAEETERTAQAAVHDARERLNALQAKAPAGGR